MYFNPQKCVLTNLKKAVYKDNTNIYMKTFINNSFKVHLKSAIIDLEQNLS